MKQQPAQQYRLAEQQQQQQQQQQQPAYYPVAGPPAPGYQPYPPLQQHQQQQQQQHPAPYPTPYQQQAPCQQTPYQQAPYPVMGAIVHDPNAPGAYGATAPPLQQQQQYATFAPTPSQQPLYTAPAPLMAAPPPMVMAKSVAATFFLCSLATFALSIASAAAPFVTFSSNNNAITGTVNLQISVFAFSGNNGPTSGLRGAASDLYCDTLANAVAFARTCAILSLVLSICYCFVCGQRWFFGPVGRGIGPILLVCRGSVAMACAICMAVAGGTYNYSAPTASDGTAIPFDPLTARCPFYYPLTGRLQAGHSCTMVVMFASAALFMLELFAVCCKCLQSGRAAALAPEEPKRWYTEHMPRLWLMAISIAGVGLAVVGLADTTLHGYSVSSLITNGPVTLDVGLVTYGFRSRTSTVANSGSINTLACNSPLLSNLQASRVTTIFALLLTVTYTVINGRRIREVWNGGVPTEGKRLSWTLPLTTLWGVCMVVSTICNAAASDGRRPMAGCNLTAASFDPQQTPCCYLRLFYWRYGPAMLGSFVSICLAALSFMSELGVLNRLGA